ncbi:hypothetical protein [Streptococcus jiangjianxini]|uniref:hypothetical protein n=1 Tax=Streptococcus jiangjianxini TaxID=3161189 RepID=UPI0032EE4B0A
MIKKVKITMADDLEAGFEIYDLPDEFENELLYRYENNQLLGVEVSEHKFIYINLKHAKFIEIERGADDKELENET